MKTQVNKAARLPTMQWPLPKRGAWKAAQGMNWLVTIQVTSQPGTTGPLAPCCNEVTDIFILQQGATHSTLSFLVQTKTGIS